MWTKQNHGSPVACGEVESNPNPVFAHASSPSIPSRSQKHNTARALSQGSEKSCHERAMHDRSGQRRIIIDRTDARSATPCRPLPCAFEVRWLNNLIRFHIKRDKRCGLDWRWLNSSFAHRSSTLSPYIPFSLLWPHLIDLLSSSFKTHRSFAKNRIVQ